MVPGAVTTGFWGAEVPFRKHCEKKMKESLGGGVSSVTLFSSCQGPVEAGFGSQLE